MTLFTSDDLSDVRRVLLETTKNTTNLELNHDRLEEKQ
jgi:hypothetical protein